MKPGKNAAFRTLLKERHRFSVWLISQQLEEASFLYEQRRFLLDNDQLPWCDVADSEDRFQRHLFALTLLTGRAIGPSDIDRLIEDAGGLHTAVSLYCRQGDFNALEALIASADLSDRAQFSAIADGLKWELPLSWRQRVVQLAGVRQDDRLVDLLARVFGYRRWSLETVLGLAPGRISPEIIWAIGRSGAVTDIALLERLLTSDRDALKTDAAVVLLRLGHTRHLQGIFPITDPHHWGILPLGLSGMGGIQERLERLAAFSPSAETLLALGLLGRPTAVELLISLLTDETYGGHASAALQLLTGANLYETVFVPDEIHPDELTDEERQRLERGEPVFEDGKVPGDTVDRLSRDVSVWESWWHAHRCTFAENTPYRLGKPYAPSILVEQLSSDRSTGLIRNLAYEELVIRYRIDFAFETDFSVSEQQRLLTEFGRWLSNHGEVAARYAG